MALTGRGSDGGPSGRPRRTSARRAASPPTTTMPPSGARLSRRLAMCTVMPATSKSVEKSVATVRASTSPECMPTRIGMLPSGSALAAACMASAAQQPRTAWSSCGLGAPNSAMMPSPCHAHHRALEAAHRLLHGLDRGRQPVTGFLGVEAFDQAGRSRDVGEQHGDLLQLAVRGGRGGLARAGTGLHDAALGAEAGIGRVGMPARRAGAV